MNLADILLAFMGVLEGCAIAGGMGLIEHRFGQTSMFVFFFVSVIFFSWQLGMMVKKSLTSANMKAT